MYALIDNAKLKEEMTRLSAKGEMGWTDTYNQQNKNMITGKNGWLWMRSKAISVPTLSYGYVGTFYI